MNRLFGNPFATRHPDCMLIHGIKDTPRDDKIEFTRGVKVKQASVITRMTHVTWTRTEAGINLIAEFVTRDKWLIIAIIICNLIVR